MDTSGDRSLVVPSVGCVKKRIYSSKNGGGYPKKKKKIRSTYGRSRKPEPSRLQDSVGLKSIVCTPMENIDCKNSCGVDGVASSNVDVRHSDGLVCNDDNPTVLVGMPNVGEMKDHKIGEEFGDLLARLNSVGPSMQQWLKECEESIVSKDEEILKLRNELQEEKANVSRLLHVAEQAQQRADGCEVEKESTLLREKLLTCELDVLKSKYVEKDKRIGILQRELETANKVGRARHNKLEQEIIGLRESRAQLNARNAALREVIDELQHDRWWLITEGFSYVFDKLRKSVEFLRPYGIARSLLLKSKYQDGLRVGYDLCSRGLGFDVLPGYDPDIARRLNVAVDDLDALDFPYLRNLAANADKSLDVIRAIVPDAC